MRRGLTTIAVLGCLTAAGCGGDDGDDGGSASKTDWVEQANAICQESQEKLAALPKKLGLDPDSPGRRKETEILDDELEQLRALDPPGEVAGDFDRMVTLTERERALFDDFSSEVTAAVKTDDPGTKAPHLEKSVKIGDQRKRLGNQASKLARDLQLETCAGR